MLRGADRRSEIRDQVAGSFPWHIPIPIMGDGNSQSNHHFRTCLVKVNRYRNQEVEAFLASRSQQLTRVKQEPDGCSAVQSVTSNISSAAAERIMNAPKSELNEDDAVANALHVLLEYHEQSLALVSTSKERTGKAGPSQVHEESRDPVLI